MIRHLIKQYDFNLAYTKELVSDLNEEKMTMVPTKGLENHPSFTIGHLITGSWLVSREFSKDHHIPNDWRKLFLRRGLGDPRLPDPDINKYPPKKALLKELERQHDLVKDGLRKCSEKELLEKVEWGFGNYMPQIWIAFCFYALTMKQCTWRS